MRTMWIGRLGIGCYWDDQSTAWIMLHGPFRNGRGYSVVVQMGRLAFGGSWRWRK